MHECTLDTVIYFWEMLATLQGEGHKYIFGFLGTIPLYFTFTAGSHQGYNLEKGESQTQYGELEALPRLDKREFELVEYTVGHTLIQDLPIWHLIESSEQL